MKKIYLVFCIFISIVCFINISKAQCTFTTAVPYFETFAGVTSPNQLPTCWSASNLGNTCLTAISALPNNLVALTGNQYAYFAASPVGANYFYSQGIQLNTGVIYSTSLWFQTEYYGYTNWSDLSILIGPNQNTLNLVQVASTNTTAVSTIYKSVSNTFTVASSGIYYFAIRATSSSSTGAQYLVFDDFKIDSLCMAPLNITASASSICSGQSVSLSVSGANTYTWNTGSNATTIIVTPNSNSTYSVVGTNTLTGCSSSASLNLSVNSSPNVINYANPPVICLGSSAILTAFGAVSYSWSSGQQGNSITVSPSVSTSYSVIGTNNYGCTSNAVQLIQVNPLPTLTVVSAMPSSTICNGDLDTLNASGANSYTWTYSQNTLLGSQIIVTPSVTTNYTVMGKDNNGCTSQTTFVLNVNGCTGLNHLLGTNNEIAVFPNPFQNVFLISTGSYELKTIVITDINGRVILDMITKEEQLLMNTRYYALGIYYVKISSETQSQFFKMIKN
jgi:hypothetical protein